MSQSRIKVSSPPPKRNKRFEIMLWAFGVVATVFCAVLTLSRWPSNQSYIYERGTLLETRIVPVSSVQGNFGGRIIYQTEARVRYLVEGQAREEWIPASEHTSDWDLLQIRLSARHDSCLVYWFPDSPDHPKCQLE
jgi:hypothetical protein